VDEQATTCGADVPAATDRAARAARARPLADELDGLAAENFPHFPHSTEQEPAVIHNNGSQSLTLQKQWFSAVCCCALLPQMRLLSGRSSAQGAKLSSGPIGCRRRNVPNRAPATTLICKGAPAARASALSVWTGVEAGSRINGRRLSDDGWPLARAVTGRGPLDVKRFLRGNLFQVLGHDFLNPCQGGGVIRVNPDVEVCVAGLHRARCARKFDACAALMAIDRDTMLEVLDQSVHVP